MTKTSFVKTLTTAGLIQAFLLAGCDPEVAPATPVAAAALSAAATKDPTSPAQGTINSPSSPSASGTAETCIADRQALLSDMAALTASHARGCRRDDECRVVAVSTRCQDACSLAVLETHVEALTRDLQALGKRCDGIAPTCGIAASCAVVDGAICLEGTCRPHLPTPR